MKYIYTTCTYIQYFSTVIFVLPSYQSLPVTLLHRVHWIQTDLEHTSHCVKTNAQNLAHTFTGKSIVMYTNGSRKIHFNTLTGG